MRVDPLPTPAELSHFHELEYRRDYKGVRTPKLKHIYRAGRLAVSRLERLSPHMATGATVLDVGSSSGEWLYLLGATGRLAQGLEVNPDYAGFGRREYGVEIQMGSIWDKDLPEQSFDMITMFHVLEHLPNPVQSLARLRRWSKVSGLFAVEVPNINSAHQHPAKRFHYAHPIGFTPESLSLALRLAGWVIVELSLDRHDRNILAIARPQTPAEQELASSPAAPPAAIPHPIVDSWQASLGYYLRPSTYSRWLDRMLQFSGEFQAVRANRSPRQLLDHVASARQ